MNQNFDSEEILQHEYFDISIKIIDLLLLSQEEKIDQMNLKKDITLQNVFYEEPMDSDAHIFNYSDSKADKQNGAKKPIDSN
jgi:t-SNARE complex subunit (syntaxin)